MESDIDEGCSSAAADDQNRHKQTLPEKGHARAACSRVQLHLHVFSLDFVYAGLSGKRWHRGLAVTIAQQSLAACLT